MAKSFYDTAQPASFLKADPIYFIQKNNAEIVELPNSKKKLIAAFPDKKDAINQYFKDNKGDFSNKADLQKLAAIL
ncbi:hypothetical protein [Halpernia frigidisoli]|uniref:hypothetical protein n=1 Tax=Halpernia frigidisoli TaxID=1125876 RepID=UPI000B7E97F6|nr:hypothetical protein [Halpernia frigidisoli]